MADYNNWKVVDLKSELKRRGIAQTGLRLKQQLVDKLIEADNDGGAAAEENGEAPAEPGPVEEPEQPASEGQGNGGVEEADAQQPAGDESTKVNGEEDTPVKEQAEEAGDAQEKTPSEDVTMHDAPEQPGQPDQSVEAAHVQAEEAPAKSEGPEAEAGVEQGRPSPSPKTDGDNGAVETSEQNTDGAKEQIADEKQEPEQSSRQSEDKANDNEVAPSEEQADVDSGKRKRSESAPSEDEYTAKRMKAAVDAIEHEENVAKGSRETSTEEKHEPRPRSHDDVRRDASTPAVDSQDKLAGPTYGEPSLEHTMSPALHPTTRSLYISNLMRPLQPNVLKEHLLGLTTPRGESPDENTIEEFFLDPIKTHCFATFSTVSAASSVRAALQHVIWPDEKLRKPLWVDYVPEDKIPGWIETEQASSSGPGPSRGALRWEVVYRNTESGVEVELRSFGGSSGPLPGPGLPPTEPRADRRVDAYGGGRGLPGPEKQHGKGFQALDERFKCTHARPRLYYLPVPRDVAEKRLDRFDDLAKSDAPFNAKFPGADELRRYTFEDDDYWVHLGQDGPSIGARRGTRGGRGRRGGGRFRDSWRGRGW